MAVALRSDPGGCPLCRASYPGWRRGPDRRAARRAQLVCPRRGARGLRHGTAARPRSRPKIPEHGLGGLTARLLPCPAHGRRGRLPRQLRPAGLRLRAPGSAHRVPTSRWPDLVRVKQRLERPRRLPRPRSRSRARPRRARPSSSPPRRAHPCPGRQSPPGAAPSPPRRSVTAQTPRRRGPGSRPPRRAPTAAPKPAGRPAAPGSRARNPRRPAAAQMSADAPRAQHATVAVRNESTDLATAHVTALAASPTPARLEDALLGRADAGLQRDRDLLMRQALEFAHHQCAASVARATPPDRRPRGETVALGRHVLRRWAR